MSNQLEFDRDEMYTVTPISSEVKEYPLHVEINMQEETTMEFDLEKALVQPTAPAGSKLITLSFAQDVPAGTELSFILYPSGQLVHYENANKETIE